MERGLSILMEVENENLVRLQKLRGDYWIQTIPITWIRPLCTDFESTRFHVPWRLVGSGEEPSMGAWVVPCIKLPPSVPSLPSSVLQ